MKSYIVCRNGSQSQGTYVCPCGCSFRQQKGLIHNSRAKAKFRTKAKFKDFPAFCMCVDDYYIGRKNLPCIPTFMTDCDCPLVIIIRSNAQRYGYH